MTRNLEKPGRNNRCPCGSGRKFKQCCAGKPEQRSRVVLVAVICAVLGAILLGLASFSTDSTATGPRRVWSPEHGHYHDVP